MTTTQVLSVASEVYPLIKTGGLADVVGALPAALTSEGCDLTTLVPGYPAVMNALEGPTEAWAFPDLWGGSARLISGRAAGLRLFVLDAPHLFSRSGGPYADAHGRDWPDNPIRFAALANIGARLGLGLLGAYRPDVVHAHDWQAGLTAAYLHYADGPRPATVMSVHNLAFQGQFDRSLMPILGFPDAAFTPDGVEYYGALGFLKSGLLFSDRITTVSPTYAAEICTPDGGMGLSGLLRGRSDRLIGILNGIDTSVWNPRTDPAISAPFDAGDLAPRARNKHDLQRRLGLALDPAAPLFAVVSRLSWQKGLDLLLDALPALLASGAQLAVLGSGDDSLEAALAAAAASSPAQAACVFGYDEGLAHLFQAGADAIVVPSRFEPCGLTQLCALRYGAVPVVARVGGLSDTVIDAGPMALAAGAATGLQFSPVTGPMLEAALRRAVALYRDGPVWRRLQANGLSTDVSWRQPAQQYAALYKDLVAERAA